jgi:hypothetical protein
MTDKQHLKTADGHADMHSQHGPNHGEHTGRALNPTIKVADLAWLEFVKPDLKRAETFARALRFSRLTGSLSPSATHANGSVGTRLPPFHARAADRTHVAYTPDTAWPEHGHPPDSSRADLLHPGFDAT